jgi:hypothetical protein
MRAFASLRLSALICAFASATLGAQVPAAVLIGGEDDLSESLAEPQDVQLISGRIVVLEREAPFLKLFALNGRLVQRVGRAGAGPGELRYGAAMLYLPATRRLLVFDTPNARVSAFAVGDTLSFARSFATSLGVSGACMLGQRLFIAAYAAAGIVHEVAPQSNELRVLRSFGEPTAKHPLAAHPLFRSYAGQGSLFCDTASNRLLLASQVVGVLHRLSADGTSQSTDPIAGFEAVVMEAAPDNGFRQKMPASGVYDQVVGFRETQDGAHVILGRADREHTGAGDFATYREVRVTRDGVQRPEASSPWRFVGQADGRTVCYRTAPAPTIAVVRTAGCPAK